MEIKIFTSVTPDAEIPSKNRFPQTFRGLGWLDSIVSRKVDEGLGLIARMKSRAVSSISLKQEISGSVKALLFRWHIRTMYSDFSESSA